MNVDERRTLKELILDEISKLESFIAGLEETTKPVSPDNAIGRLTRMEAINSKSISEANLGSSRQRLSGLKKALERVDEDPDFGICSRCEKPIPQGRILLMPEVRLCVSCVGKK